MYFTVMKNQLLIMKRNQLNLGNLIKSNLLDQLCKLLSRIKNKKIILMYFSMKINLKTNRNHALSMPQLDCLY